jgi:hypothetical protein
MARLTDFHRQQAAAGELRVEAAARTPVCSGHGEQRPAPSGGSHSQPQGAPPLVARRWGDGLEEAAPAPRKLHREPQPVRRRAPPP